MSSTMPTPTRAEPTLVSVIIATYNRAQLLRQTVESVLAQTYPHIELIVIDDGSPDDTPAVMAAYGDRIVYVRQANQGGSAACNNGFAISKGAYVTFLDHDDLMAPTKIARQVQVLESDPSIGLCHCQFNYIDQEGALLQGGTTLPEKHVLAELAKGDFIWSGGPLIRRDVLDHVGLHDLAIWSADWDMWLRIALAGYRFHCVQEILGSYRMVGTSMQSNIKREEEGHLRLLGKLYSQPNLPPELLAVRDEAYYQVHFQESCWYYAAGECEDGQRCLLQALERRPALRERPADLIQEVVRSIFDPRLRNPERLIANLFAHLPPGAMFLARYAALAQGLLAVGQYMRVHALGRAAPAELLQAVRENTPVLLQEPEETARFIAHAAMKLPVADPVAFAHEVCKPMVSQHQAAEAIQARVLSDVSLACAFQSFATDRPQVALNYVLQASRYRPACLKNRGVQSMLAKSLAALPMQWLRSGRVRRPQAGSA